MTTTDLVLRPTTELTAPAPAELAATTPAGDLATRVDKYLGADLSAALGGIFERMEWAEDEILKARTRHPQRADRIWHSFKLLTEPPAHERLKFEIPFRAHCAELLDRVAAGKDTRPGTAAEVCCAMMQASLMTPITSSAMGLYMRMWHAAGLPEFPEMDEASRHHEALEKSVIDDHEAFTRRKLAVADRHLRGITCEGKHHGVTVTCALAAAPAQKLLDAPAQMLLEV